MKTTACSFCRMSVSVPGDWQARQVLILSTTRALTDPSSFPVYRVPSPPPPPYPPSSLLLALPVSHLSAPYSRHGHLPKITDLRSIFPTPFFESEPGMMI